MADNKKKNPFNGIVAYFKDVKGEMKKVAWPSLKQVKNNTIIVLICVIIIGAFIAVLDIGFGKGYDFLVNKASTEQTTDAAKSDNTKDKAATSSTSKTAPATDSGAKNGK